MDYASKPEDYQSITIALHPNLHSVLSVLVQMEVEKHSKDQFILFHLYQKETILRRRIFTTFHVNIQNQIKNSSWICPGFPWFGPGFEFVWFTCRVPRKKGNWKLKTKFQKWLLAWSYSFQFILLLTYLFSIINKIIC